MVVVCFLQEGEYVYEIEHAAEECILLVALRKFEFEFFRLSPK